MDVGLVSYSGMYWHKGFTKTPILERGTTYPLDGTQIWKHIQFIAFTFSFSPYHASVTMWIVCQIPTIALLVMPSHCS